MHDLEKLKTFVKEQHSTQVRKYTGEPYFNHLLAVAEMAGKTDVRYAYEIGLCHDLFEDTNCDPLHLRYLLFDLQYDYSAIWFISGCVKELTDVYTPVSVSGLNRAARKQKEAERLWSISPAAQTVKYCDLIDNTVSIVRYDPGFAVKYLAEKKVILSGMNSGDADMYKRCLESLEWAYDELKKGEEI